MSTPTLFWNNVTPGDRPVFIFPVLVTTLHVDLQMFAEDKVTDGLVSAGTGTIIGSVEVIDGQGGPLEATFSFDDTEKGDAIGDVLIKEHPLSGQLANLNVRVSKNGGAFSAGAGTLAEISDGYYKYTVAAAETDTPGNLLVRIYPTDPLASVPGYICETVCNAHIMAPGYPSTNATPSSVQNALSETFDDLKNFIRSAIRDLLGNQMTNKPTFKKD